MGRKNPAVRPNGQIDKEGKTAIAEWRGILEAAACTDDTAPALKPISGGAGQALLWLAQSWMGQQPGVGREALEVVLRKVAAGVPDWIPVKDQQLDKSAGASSDASFPSKSGRKRPARTDRSEVVVPDLAGKLAGRNPASVWDAIFMVAGIVHRPEPFAGEGRKKAGKSEPPSRLNEISATASNSVLFGARFVRALVKKEIGAEKAEDALKRQKVLLLLLDRACGGRGGELVDKDLDPATTVMTALSHWVIPLRKAINAEAMFRGAAQSEGAMITAASKSLFVTGSGPEESLFGFARYAEQFAEWRSTPANQKEPQHQHKRGIAISIVNAQISVGKPCESFYNIGHFLMAVQSYAATHYSPLKDEMGRYKTDWSKWRNLNHSYCLVVKNPTLYKSDGKSIDKRSFDKDVRSLLGIDKSDFDDLPYISDDTDWSDLHILGIDMQGWSSVSSDEKFHVNIHVKGDEKKHKYYFAPTQEVLLGDKSQSKQTLSLVPDSPSERKRWYITGSSGYFVEIVPSNRNKFDDAYRAVYEAVRGRLKLDTGERHIQNLRQAAILREKGFEVLPLHVAMPLFLLPAPVLEQIRRGCDAGARDGD